MDEGLRVRVWFRFGSKVGSGRAQGRVRLRVKRVRKRVRVKDWVLLRGDARRDNSEFLTVLAARVVIGNFSEAARDGLIGEGNEGGLVVATLCKRKE